METNLEKPSNPRMSNPDGVYASEARLEDCVTLRDNFAGLALQALLSQPNIGMVLQDLKCASMGEADEQISITCYRIADTMLNIRSLETKS